MAELSKSFVKIAAILIATIGDSPTLVFGQRLPGQENEPVPVPTSERAEHLQKAVRHLEAAGLVEEARQIRKHLQITNTTETSAIPTRDESANSATSSQHSSKRQSQVIIHTQLIELPVSKMRKRGFNIQSFSGRAQQLETPAHKGYSVYQDETSALHFQEAETYGPTTLFDLSKTPDPKVLAGVIQALRQHDLAKVLAEPTIVTMDGRPASFAVEGKTPVHAQNGSGDNTQVEYERTGTRLDVCPQLVDDDRIRIELRLEWSGLGGNPAAEKGVSPRLRRQSLDTGFEITLGDTIALAASPGQSEESKTAEDMALFVLVTADLVDRMPPAKPTAQRGPVYSSPTLR